MGIKCKWCESNKVIRKGYSGFSRNFKFKCKECNRTFTLLRKNCPDLVEREKARLEKKKKVD